MNAEDKPSVDLSRIKVGDEVTVRLRAAPGFCPQLTMLETGLGARFMVPHSAIVSHTPKALSVGDRVSVDGAHTVQSREAFIIHISGNLAWVRWGDNPGNGNNLVGLNRLERAS